MCKPLFFIAVFAMFGVSTLGVLTLASPSAWAEGLSRSDKLRVLYSNQFAFDRRGVPLITIGIVEGAREVVLEGSRGLRVLPDGEDGSEVRGGARWKVSIISSKKAAVEHFVILARVAMARYAALAKARKVWEGRGAKVRMIEVGTIFGIKGHIFDNRAFVLVEGPFKSRRAARQRAEAHLAKKWLDKVATVAQLAKRPSARLQATDLGSGTQIRLRDAVWFAPASDRGVVSVGSVEGRSLGKKYWGQLYVTVDRNGRLAVVNAVPADKLLAGLVPAEIFPSAPIAALRAQAIAARSDLLSKIGTRHFVDPYLICSWQHCQVYRGAGYEQARTTKAVTTTRGLILARKDGGLVDAVYHAVSGGFTEDNEKVWPGSPDPVLRGKLDGPGADMRAYRGGITEQNIARWLAFRPQTWSARSGMNRTKVRWRVRRSSASISAKLKHLGMGPVVAIKVLSRGRSGRARLVEVRGALGKGRVRGELAIRRAFGNLRSSMFIVSPVRGASGAVVAFEFTGGGWGHGVGMCQTGAIGMAKAGRRFKQILQHYYSHVDIRRLY
ncbi:MAG: SpoIID/LytB domain-containing protein [Deltaproteobacteria bacterium]|nr:SpoIID/LytB domain-containing protein [Deltaproteobacteria bacterium]